MEQLVHYQPIRTSPTACGDYDPIDDLSTWKSAKVTCPACLRILAAAPKN